MNEKFIISFRSRMRFTCTIFVLLAVATATAIPIRQNEDNVEELATDRLAEQGNKEADWHLVPDTDGRMHMVDISSVDIENEPLFDAYSDIIFRLWTRSNPNAGQIVGIHNNQQLDASHFNPGLQTRFHIHGWGAGGELHNGGVIIRTALLNQINCNVFVIDWGAGSNTPNYITARNRVNEVGAVIAQFIDWINLRGNPFSAITIIGSSLGAHVAGAAGKRTSRGRIHAIVGLDPANVLFSIDVPADRLHHTGKEIADAIRKDPNRYLFVDADYVESQVTDAGRLGFEHPFGHANFYPNFGTAQPGCGNDLVGQCGHFLVSDFMAASINPNNVFGAIRCRDINDIRQRNCVQSGTSRRMGGEPIQDGAGIVGSVYFLTTYGDYPFAHGPR